MSRFDHDYYQRFYGPTGVHAPEQIGHLATAVHEMATWWGVDIGSMLDVGAGLGMWRDWYLTHHPEVRTLSVDISEHACTTWGHERRDIAVWRPDQAYDLVVCHSVLQYVDDDAVEGARVIDLFAGTGALAIEALSRGAEFALFVDDSPEGRALLRANTEMLGLGGTTKIFRRDATHLGTMPPQTPFGLAFLDPPYRKGLAPLALASLRDGGWLAPDALCVVEEGADAEVAPPDGFELIESRQYGDAQVMFMRFRATSNT